MSWSTMQCRSHARSRRSARLISASMDHLLIVRISHEIESRSSTK
jgi:hypothetical protein